MGVHYEIIIDINCFKWMIQTTAPCPEGARNGIKIEPTADPVWKTSA